MYRIEDKNILITGAHGFLGKHLVRKLKEKGVDETNIDTPRSAEYDLRIFDDCSDVVKGKDLVIHLAAVAGGIGFNIKHPGKAFYDNAAMSLNLLEASRQENVEKFVGIGSVCEYPKFTEVPFKEEDLWKGYPEETNAPYGLAKKFMLAQSQAYEAEYGMNAIHLLMINLYGPGDDFDPESSHVIPALIKKVYDAKKEGKDYIEAWGTGKATREFIYVEDAAKGIVSATEKYNKPDPVNLGSGMEISIKGLLKTIAEIMNFEGEIEWDTTKPDGQPRRCLDVSKAKEEFDFEAKTDFREGLEKTIDWYLENEKHK